MKANINDWDHLFTQEHTQNHVRSCDPPFSVDRKLLMIPNEGVLKGKRSRVRFEDSIRFGSGHLNDS